MDMDRSPNAAPDLGHLGILAVRSAPVLKGNPLASTRWVSVPSYQAEKDRLSALEPVSVRPSRWTNYANCPTSAAFRFTQPAVRSTGFGDDSRPLRQAIMPSQPGQCPITRFRNPNWTGTRNCVSLSASGKYASKSAVMALFSFRVEYFRITAARNSFRMIILHTL